MGLGRTARWLRRFELDRVLPKASLTSIGTGNKSLFVLGAFDVACQVAGIGPRTRAGVSVAKKDLSFVMANGQTIVRSIGYALLRSQGFETVDDLVLGQPGDWTLLGARTLEGFGAAVDSQRQCLVASGPHLAAVEER